PLMGETAAGGSGATQPQASHIWAQNETWVYTGQVNVPASGQISFGENVDDSVLLKIDGNTVLNDGSWNTPTTTNVLNLTPGWHTTGVGFANGGGGAGPAPKNGWGGAVGTGLSLGFGYNATGTTSTAGTDYVLPADPGDASFFRVVLGNNSVTKT